jgi:hypothetical protein
MATSNEWTDWHLTPQGWKKGSEKTDFDRTDCEPPVDRVITVRWSDYLGHPFATARRGHTTMWQSNDIKQVEDLLQKYGEAPKHL